MQGLQQSYTQYFNLKHRKTGHLFEGRYKAIICQKDEYLLELIRYIHLNPVRAGMVKSPEQYHHSGHNAYLQGKTTEIIDPAAALRLLGGKQGYRRFVHDGLKEGHKEEYYAVEDQRFLGAEGFGKKMAKREPKQNSKARKRKSIEAVVKGLGRELNVGISELRGPSRSWILSKARTIIEYVLARRLGYTLKEVAAYFGRDIATVATLLGRLEERMAQDQELRASIERLNKKLES
jgi:putative transposase